MTESDFQQSPKRGYAIIATFATLLFLGVNSVNAQESQDVRSLQDKSLAELATDVRPDFLLGTHLSLYQVPDILQNEKSRNVITSEYNLVSVGIYQKSMQKKSQHDWDFRSVDTIVQFADENNLTVYAHPMFGSNGYIPEWLMEGDHTNEELLAIIEDRIKTILTRYKGKIHILDVYNEGLSRNSKGWREPDNLLLQLGWHENESGRWPIALEKILIWSRKYGGEDLKLIYNENNNTMTGMLQSSECIDLYKALKKAGIPINGIGIQCHTKITEDGEHHLNPGSPSHRVRFNPESFAQNMRTMGEAGIDVYITECDVHLYGTIDDEKLRQQASAYRSILKACIEEPACKSFKTWGFTDASCWKPLQKNNRALKYEPCPLVFDHDYNPKPAYRAMKELLIEKVMEK